MLLLVAVRYHHGVQNRATGAHDLHRHRTAELGRPAHDLPLGEQDGIHALNVLTPPLLTSIDKLSFSSPPFDLSMRMTELGQMPSRKKYGNVRSTLLTVYGAAEENHQSSWTEKD